jgi:uncharacterized protein involved in type VI secretion and phage assembly
MSLFDVEEVSLESPSGQKHYGKFRGTVVNNVDPKQIGRIQVMVPDVSNVAISSWALPCMPWGGIQMGMFCVPLVGAGVWVEFEQGDPDYPIWTGCYWGSAAETPSGAKLVPPVVPGITLQTPTQNMIQISDVPGPTGGIQLRTRLGAMISITDVGITITNGLGATIMLAANTVDINSGALTVI